MKLDLITKDDLKTLKMEIIEELKNVIQGQKEHKKWMKSADVKELLNISSGTLQNLRVNGMLPFTKVVGTLYYSYDDVQNLFSQNMSA